MEWNIQNNFDPGDETIHFGTRAYAESDGCIYEITTTATFQNENKISDLPSIDFGFISKGGLCVCVGNSLTVFADASSSSQLFCMAFDAQIETFTFSPDGNFLLVGLSNGFIQCLHIPSEGEQVYVKKLSTVKTGGRMFAKIIVEESCPDDVLVVCSSGAVINFYNFYFTPLNTALLNDDSSEIKRLQSSIESTALCGYSSIAPVRSVAVFKRREQLVLMAVGEGIATLSTGVGSNCDSSEVKWMEQPSTSTLLKLQSAGSEGPFLALEKSGRLLSICPYTLMVKHLHQKNSEKIWDFQLAGSNLSDIFVITLSANSDSVKTNLSMQSLSGLAEKFSLPVNRQSTLMSSRGDVEDIYFLELASNSSSETSTVSLKAATQTAPKFRMERLLTRRKFEAAESLAKNFGLDPSPIHKAKVQTFLMQMEPWRKDGCHLSSDNEMLLKSLLSELDEIVDLDFVSNCCVSAVPPDYHTAYSLLKYAHKRLELYFVNNPQLESKMSEWSESVCGSMLRLETLNLLKPSWDAEEWLEFSRADLLHEVQTRIKQGELAEASVIWSRHKYSFRSSLKEELIVDCLLGTVPAHVTLDKVLEWLAHLLPSLLEVQPSALSKIVTYMHSKISGLERSHPREWPKVGLDYTQRIVNLIASQNFSSSFIGLEASPLRQLVVLRCALDDLHTLRSKYYIFMTLEEFSQAPFDVALLLLDHIDIGSISAFINGFMNGYMLDHRIDVDDVISKYIMCVLESSDGWWHWEEAPWESRISTLIPHITNFKIRLECIIATLETAPVPWSSIISNLAEDGLKLKHPLCSLIREKQQQIGTNLILKKYGLRAVINKINRKTLLKYIVKQNQPDMLADIAEIAQKSVDDYKTIIMELFVLCNTSKALEILRKLTSDMVVQICPLLIEEASLSLDGNCDLGHVIEFISAVALCHEVAKASNPPGLTSIEDLNNPKDLPLPLEYIKNRFYLKRDFGRRLSKKEMSSYYCRLSTLKEIIQDLLLEVVESERTQDRSWRLYHRSLYASRLLMIGRNFALIELLQQCMGMDVSDVQLAAYVSGHLEDFRDLPENLCKKLVRLPYLYFTKLQSMDCKDRNVKTTRDAAEAVYEVMCKVCSHCSSGNLNEALDSFGWSRIWHFISGQDEMSLVGQRDSFKSWRFTPLYKDPGLSGFLNESNVNSFLYSAFSFANGLSGVKDTFLSDLSPTILRLQNDQHDVAVVIILGQIFSTIRRFIQQPSLDALSVLHTGYLTSCEVLLNKVASFRQLDKNLGVSLLSSMGESKSLDFLQRLCKSAQVDFQRQKSLSCLGTIICEQWNSSEHYTYFKLMSVQSIWGLRLSELGISVKELLRGKTNTDIVLQKLLGVKNVSTSLLQALCSDYNFDYQEVLLRHLHSVLLSWDPDPIVTVNADGTKDVLERNTHQQLLEQCWEIQKNITNKSTLCNTLCSVWEDVNFYHHEVFIVILEILERHGIDNQINKRLITTFLKQYRRIKAPDQGEEDYWAEVFPNSFGLPAMSEFRLPYNRRLLDSPLHVIRREFNLSTYKCWLAVADALEIPRDKICATAVHNLVTEEFSGYQNNMEWCGTRKNESLLQSVASCVAEMDDVVEAAATLLYFTNKIPSGMDQVTAANLCLPYAEIVFKETGDTAYKVKIEKKYLHLATLQTLHIHGLGQSSYLLLAANPSELIHALYRHPAILDLCRGTASHCLDINAAAEDISKLHSLSLKTLHMNLVSEWLQPDIVVDCNASFEEDCFGGMMAHSRRERERNRSEFSDLYNADDSILRACYIMDHGDVQEWSLFLVHLAYEGEASIGMKLRAMQCLCMLTNDHVLTDITGRFMSIREKLHTLAVLKHLEILGLSYSEAGFEACDKQELANLILRTQHRSQRAVSLLVHLCINYGIGNLSLWNSVLQQLVDLVMMKELERALSHSCGMFQLWTLPTFSKAWNLLLTSPFSKANYDTEEEHQSAMFHAITLFPTCPILKDIDMTDAIDHCIMNQRAEIAALLLPYVDASQIPQWQQKILLLRKPDALLEELQKINAERCISISKVLSLFSTLSQ